MHVNDNSGLVITNWHVINEAAGPISVHFPDGFYSLAQVVRADRDWDLAILSIRRPNVAPVRMAAEAPRPGEPLTIAGYGSGNYRAATGPCSGLSPFALSDAVTVGRIVTLRLGRRDVEGRVLRGVRSMCTTGPSTE